MARERKVHRAQLNNLILAADRLLDSKHAHTIESYLMSNISAQKFYNSYRWVAFTRLIRFALSRQLFSPAIALYDRLLNEGFAPFSSIRARVTALKLVDSAENIRDVLGPLTQQFADDSYDIQAFLQLLYFMLTVKNASVTIVEEAAQMYMSTKRIEARACPDLVGEVASINMRAGRFVAAQRWLRAFEDSCKTAGDQPVATPYAEIIDALMRVDPRNTPALRSVLEDMRSAGVPPNVSIFNTLMRVNAGQQRYQETFELYRVLMQRRCDHLIPNDVTFKIVFRTVRLVGRVRRAKRPSSAVDPRQIFRDMLECHLQQTEGQPHGRSTSLSASSLQSSLRTFIARGDYLGAFIVARLLDIFGFSADFESYQIVLAHLFLRIKRETRGARRSDEYRLADFLMHLRPDEVPGPNVMSHIREAKPTSARSSAPSNTFNGSKEHFFAMATETITHLLALGEPHRLSDEDLYEVWPSSGVPIFKGHRQVPTVSMLIGVEEPQLNHRCSPVPLARLLKKVFLGAIWASSPYTSDPHFHRVAEKAVCDARKRMVPNIAPADPGKAAELLQHLERKHGLPFVASRRRGSARAGWEINFAGRDDGAM